MKRIIAQPNIYSKAIREWAVYNEWKIINEHILKEDGKIYEIIVLEKGQAAYGELELLAVLSCLHQKPMYSLKSGKVNCWNGIAYLIPSKKQRNCCNKNEKSTVDTSYRISWKGVGNVKKVNGHEIITLFEKWSPKRFAMDGDPVGLHIGQLNRTVEKVLGYIGCQ